MNKNIRQITAITIMLALIVGCFATLPLQANAVKAEIPGFDYDAFYTIENGYGKGGYRISTLGYEGLNNLGDIFYIGVTNSKTGVTYDSFCANAGSEFFAGQGGLDCTGYYIGLPIDKLGHDMSLADYLSALNYIADHSSGDLDDERIVTQTVIWALLGAVDVESTAFDATYLTAAEKEFVVAALNAEGNGRGTIVDVVFMVCDKHDEGHDYSKCQPQIVPIYAKIDNRVTPQSGSISVSLQAGTKVNIKDSITGGYSKEAVSDAKGKYDHSKYAHNLGQKLEGKANNWFQFNELAANTMSATFDLVQGDKLNKVGEYTITSNGNGLFTITMSDALVASGVKLSISNTILFAKNTNDKTYDKNNIWTTSPGQQQFSASGHTFEVYAPWVNTAKIVYVYMHLDGLTGYKDTYGLGPDAEFSVTVTGPSCPTGVTKSIVMNGDTVSFDDLKPGEYAVELTGPKTDSKTVTVSPSLTIPVAFKL